MLSPAPILIVSSLFLFMPRFLQQQLTPLGEDYYRDSNHIYVKQAEPNDSLFNIFPPAHSFKEVIGADPATFVVLADGYAKDRNYVYQGQRLDNMDVKSFESIGNGFYRDKNNVRWGGVMQLKLESPESKPRSFDVYSFEVLPCGFARDKTGVYAGGASGYQLSERNKFHKYDTRIDVMERIDVVDAPSFQVTGACQAKDKNFIYHASSGSWATGMFSDPRSVRIVGSAGEARYEMLGCGFVKTPDGIFWQHRRVKFADAASFEVLIKKSDKECGYGFYARDTKHVYYQDRLIEDADPQTFQVLDTVWSYFYAFDKANRYSQGNNIKIFSGDYEMKSFEEAYAKWKQSRPPQK
jgi:hypothetical protein